jgi:2-dehydro-3-deoxy-D-arabinonate dehydratase
MHPKRVGANIAANLFQQSKGEAMQLTRHSTPNGSRWAADDRWLAQSFDLRTLLEKPLAAMSASIDSLLSGEPAQGPLLAPIEASQEVWGCGVTYQRSREARQAESSSGDVYDRVYTAQRPELFFKAIGWRVAGHGQPVRVRADSAWNVPEPEMTLVINRHGEIVGYTAGNDMSSRSIEGENPLYLPQAKIYNGSCALGPALHLLDTGRLDTLPIEISIERAGQPVFHGTTNTARITRKLDELAAYLFRELSFPHGVFLLTGTGIVPPDQFTLARKDRVIITIGDLTLANEVGA